MTVWIDKQNKFLSLNMGSMLCLDRKNRFHLADGRLLRTVGGGLKGPVAVAVAPQSNQVYVGEAVAHRIDVYD